jgi:hypothetical protein
VILPEEIVEGTGFDWSFIFEPPLLVALSRQIMPLRDDCATLSRSTGAFWFGSCTRCIAAERLEASVGQDAGWSQLFGHAFSQWIQGPPSAAGDLLERIAGELEAAARRRLTSFRQASVGPGCPLRIAGKVYRLAGDSSKGPALARLLAQAVGVASGMIGNPVAPLRGRPLLRPSERELAEFLWKLLGSDEKGHEVVESTRSRAKRVSWAIQALIKPGGVSQIRSPEAIRSHIFRIRRHSSGVHGL